MRKFVFLVVAVFFVQFLDGQQVQVDSLCRQAYGEIMSLRFVPARKILKTEKQHYPDNVYVDYLENYMDFLRVFIGENQALFDQLNDNFDTRYNRVKQLPDSSRYKNLLLANMNLQWAFARLKFGQYFSAAWEMNRAYRLLTGNTENFPYFVPNYITLGVLHVMIGLVPDKYGWMLKIISMEGSVEQGKAEIYKALDNTTKNSSYAYLHNEALFYLGFIELNLSPDRKALDKLLLYLDETDNSNLLMDFLKTDIHIRYGQNDLALKQLNNLPQSPGYLPFYYLRYLKGECYLKKLETDSATVSYAFFLKHFEGLNYIKDAWRKRAWAALLQNNPDKYLQLMDSVKTNGATEVGADKEALSEANSGTIPNTNLIRARLLFDGGYYARAKKILDTMDIRGLSKDEQTERIYRYARIAHRQNNIPLAKRMYRQTITTGSLSPRYFAANSALKLGEIYESEDSLKLANIYYEKCLDLNFDEYRNSIRGKAKEALARIQE
jgi:hypothetical protein